MNKYNLLAALLLSTSASAMDFEIGIGRTTFTPSDNGVWYQEGLPHKLEMDSNSIKAGFTDYLTDSIRWHVGYMHLGKTSSWAIATWDNDYSFETASCRANPCIADDVYIGHGEVQGIYFTAAPEYVLGDFKLIAEGGVWFYNAEFNMTVIGRNKGSPGNTVFWNSNKQPGIQVRPVFGLGVEYKSVQLMLNMLGVDSSGEDINHIPNYKGYSTNLSLIKRF